MAFDSGWMYVFPNDIIFEDLLICIKLLFKVVVYDFDNTSFYLRFICFEYFLLFNLLFSKLFALCLKFHDQNSCQGQFCLDFYRISIFPIFLMGILPESLFLKILFLNKL